MVDENQKGRCGWSERFCAKKGFGDCARARAGPELSCLLRAMIAQEAFTARAEKAPRHSIGRPVPTTTI